jgi:hypothetical protein
LVVLVARGTARYVVALVCATACCTPHHRFDNSIVQRPNHGSAASTAVVPTTNAKVDSVTLAAQELWAKRNDQQSAKSSVDAWQRVTLQHPDSAEAFERLAQASHFFATSFKQDDATAIALYSSAIVASERGLRIASPAFETAQRNGGSVAGSLDIVTDHEAPLLYWHAISLGAWAAKGGLMDQMSEMPKVRKIMHWLDEHAANYDGAGAARWLGAYYAAAPSIAGGDMKESRRFFERAVTLAPSRLDNHFHFAELFARGENDAALWRTQLEFAAAVQLASDALPEDLLAQQQAKRLLARGFKK